MTKRRKNFELVGLFDIEQTTNSKNTREYLKKAEKRGKLTAEGGDLPRSFAVLSNGEVRLSGSNVSVIVKRLRAERKID